MALVDHLANLRKKGKTFKGQKSKAQAAMSNIKAKPSKPHVRIYDRKDGEGGY